MSRRVRVRPYRGPVATEQEESAGAVEQAGNTADDDGPLSGSLLQEYAEPGRVLEDLREVLRRSTGLGEEPRGLTLSINHLWVNNVLPTRMINFHIRVSIHNGIRSEDYEAVETVPVEMLQRGRSEDEVVQDVCRRLLASVSSRMAEHLTSAFMIHVGR